jgi:hypothetical protein
MHRLTFLSALLMAAMPLTAHAQKAGHPATGSHSASAAKTNANANVNAAAHEREMMRQQQLMIQQQQAFEREQMKLYEQQQKAMQLQAREQRQMLLQHLRAMQQGGSSPSQSLSSVGTTGTSNSTAMSTSSSSGSGSNMTHSSKSRSGKTHSGSVVTGTTGNTSHQVIHRSGWYVWPRSSTFAYRNLMALKTTLDTIATNRQPVGVGQTSTTLQNRLYAVHNTNAMAPSRENVQKLATDLTSALVNRAQGNTPVDTRALALHMRAMMNTPYLNVSEFQESLAEQRAVLNNANVQPEHADTVVKDVYGLAEDVLNRSL